jgi:hypothetical protein
MDLNSFVHVSRYIIFYAVFLPCTLADFRTGLVSRAPLLFLVAVLALSSAIAPIPGISFFYSVSGAGTGMAIYFFARKITGGRLGLADVWLAGAVGALGGISFLAVVTLFSVLIFFATAIVKKNLLSGTSVPFFPAMLAGCFFSHGYFFLAKVNVFP